MTNSNIEDKTDMPDKWLEPRKWEQYMRILYIESIQAHVPSKCPECHTLLEVDEEQIYCPKCGLVTQDSYDFAAGTKYVLPHGIKLM